MATAIVHYFNTIDVFIFVVAVFCFLAWVFSPVGISIVYNKLLKWFCLRLKVPKPWRKLRGLLSDFTGVNKHQPEAGSKNMRHLFVFALLLSCRFARTADLGILQYYIILLQSPYQHLTVFLMIFLSSSVFLCRKISFRVKADLTNIFVISKFMWAHGSNLMRIRFCVLRFKCVLFSDVWNKKTEHMTSL